MFINGVVVIQLLLFFQLPMSFLTHSTSKQNNLQRGVMVHSISNGGAFVFQQMTYLFQEESNYMKPFVSALEGIVFDSAPCYMSLKASRSMYSSWAEDRWCFCMDWRSIRHNWYNTDEYSRVPSSMVLLEGHANVVIGKTDKLEELVEYRAANAESNITDPSPSKYFFKGMAHVTNIRNKDLFNEGVSELMDHHQALHSTPLPPPPQHQQQQQ
eukprot:m.74282 g.74282  ORF g.74282 m.74282 type:complete len:213 (-) comp11795_c0_seq3:860-1498(-)